MRAIWIAVTSCLSYTFAKTSGELCDGTATNDNGNYYCAEVTKITYHNISQYGSYLRTTNMDLNSGLCSHENVTYPSTGTLTPLLGEVSMHLRGPMNLTQLAVYTLSCTVFNERSSIQEVSHKDKRHRGKLGGYLRKNGDQDQSKRDVGDLVIASIDGQTVSWINAYNGTPAIQNTGSSVSPAAPAFVSSCDRNLVTVTVTEEVQVTITATEIAKETSMARAEATNTSDTKASSATTLSETLTSTNGTSVVVAQNSAYATVTITSQASESQQSAASPTTPQPSTTVPTVSGTWSRVAYYQSATSAHATGLAFLNHRGTDGVSGTFDTTFGNSLSYASNDGTTCAENSTSFNGNLSTSEVELAVFTDHVCNGDCDYTRPKSVAHHGWTGDAKAFFIEFQMDHYNNTPAANQGLISDAPAWWFLNANIPRVLQYGDDRGGKPCACWAYGCGEFDAFEILEMGEMRAKSTLHRQGNLEGGDSNYFVRPVGKTIKVAVVWWEYDITVAILDDSFSFSESLTGDQMANIVAYTEQSNTESLFAIGT